MAVEKRWFFAAEECGWELGQMSEQRHRERRGLGGALGWPSPLPQPSLLRAVRAGLGHPHHPPCPGVVSDRRGVKFTLCTMKDSRETL